MPFANLKPSQLSNLFTCASISFNRFPSAWIFMKKRNNTIITSAVNRNGPDLLRYLFNNTAIRIKDKKVEIAIGLNKIAIDIHMPLRIVYFVLFFIKRK